MKSFLLCFALLTAIVVGGVGIYAADASYDYALADGYGVSERR